MTELHEDAPERVTEIGDIEQLDTELHPVAVVVGLLVVVALLALTVFAFSASLQSNSSSNQVDQVTVPRMAGRTLAEAQTQLEGLGLVVETEYTSNEVIAPDTVIGQDPVAGSRLEVGEQVVLRVSDGLAGVDLPDFSGMKTPEALRVLKTIGLLGEVENVFDEIVPQNLIIGSLPAGGSRAAPGSTVKLLVSQGPEPRTVPQILGKPVGEAIVELARAEFTLGEITQKFSADQPPGTLLSSDPAPAEQAPRGQPINLVVAAAEEQAQVPDLVGLRSSSAAKVAKSAGLRTAVTNQALIAGDPRIGLVISQTPVAFSPAAADTPIQITVGILLPPATTTTIAGARTSTTLPVTSTAPN
ncbi:MAG: PASTA domain-containing protein [Microthrixaceae bacterium]